MRLDAPEHHILRGAIDTHVHSSPDVLPRRQSDREVVADADAAGMAAIVLKNHTSPTAARAAIAGESVRTAVLGGIVLNHPCGGLNPHAVRTTLTLGGRVIWMPTISAENHLRYLRSREADPHIQAITPSMAEGISLPDGGMPAAVGEILDLIAEVDAVLATGHLSVDETVGLAHEARRRGVTHILVTHPEAPQIEMPLDVQRELAGIGAMFERCYYSLLDDTAIAASMLETMRSVGVGSTVLATDLGQVHNPPPVEGFASFRSVMEELGMSGDEWRTVACDNPARLLGIHTEADR